jgi:hypothetical protein
MILGEYYVTYEGDSIYEYVHDGDHHDDDDVVLWKKE